LSDLSNKSTDPIRRPIKHQESRDEEAGHDCLAGMTAAGHYRTVSGNIEGWNHHTFAPVAMPDSDRVASLVIDHEAGMEWVRTDDGRPARPARGRGPPSQRWIHGKRPERPVRDDRADCRTRRARHRGTRPQDATQREGVRPGQQLGRRPHPRTHP
jgi:hypothetical protein